MHQGNGRHARLRGRLLATAIAAGKSLAWAYCGPTGVAMVEPPYPPGQPHSAQG